uniref:Uncharacterized protein n=1 Tax=Panagrolaimus sp. ES5 TaxID=591445 RepID=A0AC34FDA0_9BILA
MQKAHSKNCKNTNNVFSINRNDNTSIFGSANENGDCEITLLAPVTGYLPVINSNDSNEWKGATVYAQALSITIPPSQNINVTIKLHSQKDENIYLTDSGKNGIFASPSYGGYTSEYQNSELLNTRRYDYNTYNIELNVKSMDGNGTAFFYNRDENNIPNDGYLSVCCSDYDGRLELFVTSGYHLDFYELYNFNGLYHPVGSLKNLSTSNVLWPSSIVATFSNCFTIVKTQETEQSLATLFFRRIDQSGGVNNVFQVPTISSPAINISNYNGYPSEVFFLASLSALPIIRVGSITSAYLNSYSFKSAINQKPLLSFNSNDTSNWRNIAIYTNALSLTFTADISIVFFNDNTLIMKDEQINQRGIMVSPSYTGFSTKLNGSKMLYQFSDNENITNKIRAVFGVKTLDENCTVYVENNQNNHTFTQNETYITTGNQINIFYEETTTQTDGFMIEYNLTSASKITILDGTAPTHVYWLDDLKNNETITVCSPDDSDTLQMFVTKEKYNGDLNLYYLYDSNQIDNCIGS